MASPTELERLIVRLMADAKQFDTTFEKAQKDIEAAVGKVQKLTDQFAASSMRGWEKFALQMDRVASTVGNVGRSIQTAGRALTVGVTLPLVGFGALAVHEFGKLDNALTESFSIMGDLTPQMKKDMRDLAMEMSNTSRFGSNELANSYYYLASAGLDATQSMQALSVVEQFATAGAFGLEQATELLAGSQAASGLVMKDAIQNREQLARVSDVLVQAGNKSNASVKQFAEALTNDAAVASRGFGMDLEEIVSLLEVYAQKNIKGAVAGSEAGRAIRLLSKAYSENEKVFKRMGIEVVDQTTGEYRKFVDVLADMENALKGLTGPQKSAALSMLGFEALAQGAILPLMGMSEQMREFEQANRQAAGVTKDVAVKQMSSFQNELLKLKNQITNVAIEIGEVLGPVVKWVAESVVQPAIDWWRKLSDENKRWIVVVGGVMAALGPLVGGLGTFIVVIGGALSGVVALVTSIATATAPFLLAAAAVGAMVVAVAGLVMYLMDGDAAEAWRVFVDAMLHNTFVGINAVIDLFYVFSEYLGELMDELWSGKFNEAIFVGVTRAGKLLVQFATNTAKAMTKALLGIGVNEDDFLGGLKRREGQSATSNFTENLKGVFEKAMSDLKSPINMSNAKVAGEELGAELAGGIAQGVAANANAVSEQLGGGGFMTEVATKAQKLAEDLQAQVKFFGMKSRVLDIYRLQVEGATEAELAAARAADAQLTILEKREKLMEDAKSIIKESASPLDKFNTEVAKIDEMLANGFITFDIYKRHLRGLYNEMKKGYKLDMSMTGIDAVEAGTAAAARTQLAYLESIGQGVNGLPGGVTLPNIEAMLAARNPENIMRQAIPRDVLDQVSRTDMSNNIGIDPGTQFAVYQRTVSASQTEGASVSTQEGMSADMNQLLELLGQIANNTAMGAEGTQRVILKPTNLSGS